MDKATREERLNEELEVLRALKKVSTVFDFEPAGEPPDRYTLTFRGKGVARVPGGHAEVEFADVHRCEVRLPYSYPDRPPDVRWLTPIVHPNVSFSGFINLRDIGLPWEKGMNLDVLCERLWDVARAAYMDLDKANNYSAKSWYEKESSLRLPFDHRQLRDKSAPAGSNVIQYERRGDRSVSLPSSETAADVIIIGEDTPVPEMPARRPLPSRPVRPRRPKRDDDDVLYIGD